MRVASYLVRACLAAALTAVAGHALAATVTISGQLLLGGQPFTSGLVLGPKAACSPIDSGGHFTCTVSTPWSGTLAVYADGFTFSPAAVSFESLSTSAGGVNFNATPAYGLRAEPALYRPSNSTFFLDYDYNSAPNSIVPFGAANDVPLAGDVNGDGITDLVVFRNGVWYVDTNQDGVADASFSFGAPGDRPLLADIDGDGSADAIVYRSGVWYVSAARNGVVSHVFRFGGAPGDVPLAADFDGDGIADLAIFRHGIWYIDTNRDGIADIVIGFGGVAGEIPVALDYNGDGRADIGLYRNGLWYINTNLDGALNVLVGYGAAGDIPLGGFFNRANTLFVRAGNTCTLACTQNNPYGSITAAWQDAMSGQIIRVQRGTYAEALDFTHPGHEYQPGKFGKNDIKLLGVSKWAVTVSPTAGDALLLRGAIGYQIRGVRLSSQASGARGLVLAGGPGSFIPTFPGAQVHVANSDLIENSGQNALLTGTSNAWLRYDRLDRSRASHGVSVWQASFARVVASDVSQNGYTVPIGPPPPDAGKGLDVRQDSELDARRNTVVSNLTFGVIGVDRSIVRLLNNTIATSGYNGIIVCGAAANDSSQSFVNGNYVSGNGTAAASGFNGLELYGTCIGSHQVNGNTFVSNTLNGIFVGSGTATLTNNTFKQNKIGVTLWVSDTPDASGAAASSADTVVSAFGNLFQANTVDGLFAQRNSGTTVRKMQATIGGTAAGQPNTLRDHTGGAFHAISCLNLTAQFVCPHGGNVFINNTDNIEATCPSSCVQ